MPSSSTRLEARLWPMAKPAANALSFGVPEDIMAIPKSGTGYASVVGALVALPDAWETALGHGRKLR